MAMVAPIIALIKMFDWKTVATIHQTDPLFVTVSQKRSPFRKTVFVSNLPHMYVNTKSSVSTPHMYFTEMKPILRDCFCF